MLQMISELWPMMISWHRRLLIMATIETMMLSICFGAVIGAFIANWIIIIKDIIDTRKRKKKEKEESQ